MLKIHSSWGLSTFLHNETEKYVFFSHTYRTSSYYQSFFYLPTDAQVNCLKNNFKIYIKTAPTCFGAVTPSSGSALLCLLKSQLLKYPIKIHQCGNVAAYISGSLLISVHCTVHCSLSLLTRLFTAHSLRQNCNSFTHSSPGLSKNSSNTEQTILLEYDKEITG